MKRKLLYIAFLVLFVWGFGNRSKAQFGITYTVTPNPCYGQDVATIAVTPINGVGPYTYNWSDGQSTQTAIGLVAQTYNVFVTDLSDGSNVSVDIAVNDPSLVNVNFSSTNVTCNGLSNGKITAIGGGGTPPYTYLWTNGPSTALYQNIPAGTYTVTVTDVNNCPPKVGTKQITEPAVLLANGSKTNVTCNALANGTARVNPSGGTVPYTYKWSANAGGATTSVVSGLAAGSYTCTVTDTKTCTATYIADITEPALLTVTLNTPTLSCNGDLTASLTATVNGGTTPYNHLWSTAQTTQTINGLGAGVYTYTVTDNNSCTATASRTIVDPPAILLTPSNTNNPCFGVCIATATITASGGTGTLDYLWAPPLGSTTPIVSNLCNGDYTVTVTDDNGCQEFQTVSVSGSTSLTVGLTPTNVSCFGGNNGAVTSSVSGGTGSYTYFWSPVNTTTANLTNIVADTYTLDVEDSNGCQENGNIVTVTQPTALTSSISGLITSCSVNNGTTTITANGGTGSYTYLWSTSETAQTLVNLAPGIYSATVTDANLCTSASSFTLSPVITIVINTATTPLLCFGDNDATATADVSGGTPPYGYSWTGAGSGSGSVRTGLAANSYTVTVTDTDGCSLQDPFTIVDPPQLITTPASTNASCNGICDGTLLANESGGTGTIDFLWMPGNNTTAAVNSQCAGDYTITLTDDNNCTATGMVTISENPAISPNTTLVLPNCAQPDGDILLGPSGGAGTYSYTWQPGGETTSSILGVTSGIYTVTITDIASCAFVFEIPLSNNAGPSVTTFSTNVSCNGLSDGSAGVTLTASPDPNYTFLFLPGGQTAETATSPFTFSVSALSANTYNIQTEDASGCIVFSTFDITEPSAIDPGEAITDVSCFGLNDGAITLSPSQGAGGPYTFFWEPGGATTSDIGPPLTAGDYTVTITDVSLCSLTSILTVTQPANLSVAISSTDITCNGNGDGTATANPIGGTSPYAYDWITEPPVQSISNLNQGTYTVTVTDLNLCQATQTVTINEPALLTSTKSSFNESCNGFGDGVAIMNGFGGTLPYSFFFSDGTTASALTSFTVTSVNAGIYDGTITDASGCTTMQSYTITTPPVLGVNVTVTDVNCFGQATGSAVAVPFGGTTAYTYFWSNTSETTASISGLPADDYTLTVTDANGCQVEIIATVNEPAAALNANSSGTDPLCFGSSNGTIRSDALGGTNPYAYLWSPGGQITPSVNNRSAGQYSVTVTDNNGCVDTEVVTLTDPLAISVVAGGSSANCGVANGSLILTPSGGTGAYAYSWSPGISTTNSASGLAAALYTVTVRDANNCSLMDVYPVNNIGAPTASVTTTSLTCNAICNGTATVLAAGGTPAYTYLWNDALAQTTATATGLCSGDYFIRVTDALSCIQFAAATVDEPTAITAGQTTTNASCGGVCNGAIALSPSGGNSTVYSYSWGHDGSTTNTVSGLCGALYDVTITDGNSCSSLFSIPLSTTGGPSLTVTTASLTCNGICSGTATVTAVGSSPFNYLWDDPSSQTTPVATGLCSGDYIVQVTDVAACVQFALASIITPNAIDVAENVAEATCGLSDGSIIVTPSGGTGAYAYSWNPNVSVTNTASNLAAALYTVTVTDANSCSAPFIIPVSNIGGPSLTVTTTSLICSGVCIGTATVSATGGTPGYTYLWNDPSVQTTAVATGLCEGEHFIQVTDAALCVQFSSGIVGSPAPVTAGQTTTSATCNGLCNGAIALAPSGGTPGYTYSWLPGGSTSSGLSNICSGAYTVTITDANSCVSVQPITLNENSTLMATVTSNTLLCVGDCNGTATANIISGTSPFLYTWSDPLSQANSVATNLCAGNYSVTIIDAIGCQTIVTSQVTAPAPIIVNPAITKATCGICDGQINLSPYGGDAPYTYVWNNSATSSAITNLCVGIYDVEVTDTKGCETDTSIILNSNGGVTSVSPVLSNATCYGACDGSASITNPLGGTPPYSYLWIPGGQTSSSVSNLCAGDYNVQILDANQCSYFTSATITEFPLIEDNRTVLSTSCGTTVCSGSISLNPSGAPGPYTYAWSNSSTSSRISNLCSGIYSVTITAGSGCKQSFVIPINSANGPNLTIVANNPTCGNLCNGSALVSASGGGGAPYSYLWATGGQTSDNISGLCEGVYIVQATDVAGCRSSISAEIITPNDIVFSSAVVTDETCGGSCNGTATFIANGGRLPYVYSWSDGSNQATANNLCAGTHTLILTDANSCVSQQTAAIGGPAALTMTYTVTNASCNTVSDGSVSTTVNGGIPPYVYQWVPGNYSTPGLTNVISNTYSLTVNDNIGCAISNTITVGSIITVIANAGSDVTVCQSSTPIVLDGSLSTGAINYEWGTSPATTIISNSVLATVIPDAPGITSYELTASDGTCIHKDVMIVKVFGLPDADAGSTEHTFEGKSVVIGGNPTNNSGGIISWAPLSGLNDSTLANPTATIQSTTTYTVFITDLNGCIASDTITVVVLPELQFSTGLTPNGDGVNDEWQIDDIELFPNCLVEVYNRWGELLFSSPGYEKKWDGTHKGKSLPIGTYYYIISLNDPLFPNAITGPITIMR